MTTDVRPYGDTDASGAPATPRMAAFADEQITTAARALWPGTRVELGNRVPGATSYVRRLRVGERLLYAKYSLLGVPLASLLRGTAGTWQNVKVAQGRYLRTRGTLLGREAVQLAVLHRGRHPQVARPVGYRDGVLFTEAVPGLPLHALMVQSPRDSAALSPPPTVSSYRTRRAGDQPGGRGVHSGRNRRTPDGSGPTTAARRS